MKTKRMKAKYRGYCNNCHYTIWQGETINYNGQAYHADCVVALKDDTPRRLNPSYIKLYGKVDKVKLAEQLNRKRHGQVNYKHSANRGVRLRTGR